MRSANPAMERAGTAGSQTSSTDVLLGQEELYLCPVDMHTATVSLAPAIL